jgi:hypothetical protein
MSDDYTQAVAASGQEGRQPMGNTAIDQISNVRTATTFAHPELIRRKMNIQAGDPALVPGMQPRNPVINERLGAAFVPRASVAPQTSPEAGMTQANGRIVPPRMIRSADSFSQGISTSMI